jgi:hypothetical protein
VRLKERIQDNFPVIGTIGPSSRSSLFLFPLTGRLGDVFADYLPFFKIYVSYVNNFERADEVYKSLRHNDAFAKYSSLFSRVAIGRSLHLAGLMKKLANCRTSTVFPRSWSALLSLQSLNVADLLVDHPGPTSTSLCSPAARTPQVNSILPSRL